VSEAIIFKREMGITHREFLYTLQRAVEGRTYQVRDGEGKRDGRIDIEDGDNSIVIHLPAQRVRRIATIKLPITDVEYHFVGHTQDEADRVMRRFEIHYQRGGG
jgi:hypothetical protein